MHHGGENINSIISGCRNNDRRSQELLYRNFYGAMMSFCLRYTQNEQDALEVLNTGFYKVFKNIHQYDEQKAALYTWIRTIVLNTCIDFIKTKNGRIVQQELDQAAGVDLSPEVFSKMSSEEILRVIRKLPPATQTVFNLYVMEGYAHREIAQLLQISEGTSKWHLSEARKQLKTMIRQLNE
ncbi:RNA polymerase sigma factor [Terrimonas sp. NA20]|uniref:RNA polymerase sigma factor n=1 Tax=Terrimonas ginsenosidimutans TaxID=2908004 RepID=A0ABS9KZH1_9BACT|nr:RNA polymerase sigma factor [Terrimonas ginsenosidimutans]MCG2617627.1 RNA polymerase sigma factor [Terrimonas ginsenosidimutans]